MSRYERQLSLIGEEGQAKLRKSLVAIVGAGGIGSPLSLYLASAGVNLRIIDGDLVSLNNLHRQIIYGEDDIGLPKALVAEMEIRRWNSDV
ncbi:MAG: ThiF family adenylyltransferase, partial [Candidatus Korarchaeum sp.]